MHRLLPVMVLLIQSSVHAQIDPQKIDSLSRSIDSFSKAHKSSQESFVKVQDSIYHAAIDRNVGNKSRNFDQFLAEQKKEEANDRKQAILRILIIAVFIVAVITLLRRRKTKI
jgi:hypothetical protein